MTRRVRFEQIYGYPYNFSMIKSIHLFVDMNKNRGSKRTLCRKQKNTILHVQNEEENQHT